MMGVCGSTQQQLNDTITKPNQPFTTVYTKQLHRFNSFQLDSVTDNPQIDPNADSISFHHRSSGIEKNGAQTKWYQSTNNKSRSLTDDHPSQADNQLPGHPSATALDMLQQMNSMNHPPLPHNDSIDSYTSSNTAHPYHSQSNHSTPVQYTRHARQSYIHNIDSINDWMNNDSDTDESEYTRYIRACSDVDQAGGYTYI